MKKALKKIKKELYFYEQGVKKIVDFASPATYPSELTGEISSKLTGNIDRLYGEISSKLFGEISGELYGEISSKLFGEISSGVYGDVSGVYGEISNRVYGNINRCLLTKEDRDKGINIEDLVEEEK